MVKTIIKNLAYFILSPFMVRRGRGDNICITFDDGPHPDNTARILEILAKHHTRVIFFMTGMEMEKYPHVVRNVIAAGHKVAYHGYTHQSMRKQTHAEFRHEMHKRRELEHQFNICLNLYRPPFGDLNLSGFIALVSNRCKIVMWSLDSRDSYDTEQQILKSLAANKIRRGEILLFHDDYTKTTNLLDCLLTDYKNAGIKCGVNL
ncbi:MAG: peptidoglycan-N-acetylglucosamine deacetylase [Pseudomonadota bacterium]|nr:peptidoglycan-N-acetylglucosamine deacetylase [Pseudomonadota bacterium]